MQPGREDLRPGHGLGSRARGCGMSQLGERGPSLPPVASSRVPVSHQDGRSAQAFSSIPIPIAGQLKADRNAGGHGVMARWTLSDLAWREFRPERIDQRSLQLAKSACLVEFNGHDYARYLVDVFSDDAEMRALAERWGEEERMHGMALRAWCERADPAFDFQSASRRFSEKITLPSKSARSVRGSRTGEMIARCVVECGTSFYYSSLRDAVREPVLRDICGRIARDEFRHFRLFFSQLERWQRIERLSVLQRAKVLFSRLMEGEDDELAYAWHCANGSGAYSRRRSTCVFVAMCSPILRQRHLRGSMSLLMRALIGRNGQERLPWLAILLSGVVRARVGFLAGSHPARPPGWRAMSSGRAPGGGDPTLEMEMP
jgi:rubrerythrin